jgi:pyruvate/2-oxoglutarate dehydrogenase complex dihydrolipoamide acyltransferase (E2) component
MTTPPSSKDLINGAAKAFKFDAIGTVAQGTVVNWVVKQVTKMGSGELEFFPSGDPKWQIIVTLQTTMREDADDDGRRALYVKSFMFKAVKDAIAATGAEDFEQGGYLTVVHTELGQPEKGMSPPKLFSAEYKRPSAQLLAGQAPAPQYAQQVPAQAAPQYAQQAAPQQQYAPPPAQAPAPAPAPAAASPVAAPSPEQLASVIKAGLDPQEIFKEYYQSLR